MYELLIRDSRFYHTLHRFDKDLAAQTRAARCSECGGKLDSARYPRKPRGAPAGLTAEDKLHHSLCCREPDCRTRHNPPSFRFFRGRHYVAHVFVLVSAMVGGITEKRATELRDLAGVSIRTLYRWREWWHEILPATPFWKRARARFDRPVDASHLPALLVERFRGDDQDRIRRLLFFLLPLTTSWPGAARLSMPG